VSGDECRKASIKPEIRTLYDTNDTGNGKRRAQKEVRHRPRGAVLRELPLPDPAGQPERLMSNFGAIPVEFANEKFAKVVTRFSFEFVHKNDQVAINELYGVTAFVSKCYRIWFLGGFDVVSSNPVLAKYKAYVQSERDRVE